MEGQKDAWMEKKLYGWMDRCSHFTKTLNYKNTGGPFDGLLKCTFLDRWMDECMNGGMDMWTDGQTDGLMQD